MQGKIRWLAMACLFSSMSAIAQAETLSASTDITAALGASSTVISDENVALEIPGGLVTQGVIPGLPERAELSAYGVVEGTSEELLSFEGDVLLAGHNVRAGDVVRRTGHETFALEFDASAAGVPQGAVTDAVSHSGGSLMLSFDTTVLLGGLVVDDEDLVLWDGTSFVMLLDGSVLGVDRALDLDAADFADTGFALSFDTAGSVGGVEFQDEDVLLYDSVLGSWSMLFDGSAADSDWEPADLDAVYVPEPGFFWMLVTGGLALAGLHKRHA